MLLARHRAGRSREAVGRQRHVGGRTTGGRDALRMQPSLGCWPVGSRSTPDIRKQAPCSTGPRATGPAPPAWSAPPGGRREPCGASQSGPPRRARGVPAWTGRAGRAPRDASAARSCGRWRPGTATSWRPSLCGTRSRSGPARCWSGANGGARTRCRSRRSIRPTTRTWHGDLAALRDTRRRLAEARAEGSPTAARLDEERARLERAIRRRTHHLRGTSAAIASVPGGELVGVPRRHDVRGARRHRRRAARTGRPVRPGHPSGRGPDDARRSRRSRSPGSRCGRRPAGDPRTSTTSGVGCRWRCWGTPYVASVTGPWSSLHPGGCTPLPGRWSRR